MLVRIQSLGKALKNAPKESVRVVAANKEVRGTTGRLLAANKQLEAKATTVSKELLRLEAELARVQQQQQSPPMQQQPRRQQQAAPMQQPPCNAATARAATARAAAASLGNRC